MRKKLNPAQKRVSRAMDYKKVFGSEQGKRVLYDLMRNHYVMQHTYSKADFQGITFREGQRNVVLRIIQLIGISEEQMNSLFQEASSEV